MPKLQRDSCAIVVIDFQEKLAPVIHGMREVEQNLNRLVRGGHLLDVPVIVTEQYVKGLGPTTSLLRQALEETGGYDPIEKMSFSGFGCSAFADRISSGGFLQILIAGVETHVCVYQTAMDLIDAGLEVQIVTDAVSSRSAENKATALRRLAAEGAKMTSTEMALFELTVESGSELFRSISRLVR